MTKSTFTIQEMIGRQFLVVDESASGLDTCWIFCRDTARRMGIRMPDMPSSLVKNVYPSVGKIALFNLGNTWHCGIIWPDCLHFVHACPQQIKGKIEHIVRKERLTLWPWNRILEGFYCAA